MTGDDLQAITRKTEEVQQASQALAQMAQAASQHGGQTSGRGGGGRPDVAEGEVIDAEPVETGEGT